MAAAIFCNEFSGDALARAAVHNGKRGTHRRPPQFCSKLSLSGDGGSHLRAATAQLITDQTETGDHRQPGRRLRNSRDADDVIVMVRSEEHTSELQSLMRISYAV